MTLEDQTTQIYKGKLWLCECIMWCRIQAT